MRMALRPHDPVDATERRRDEQDLARLRRRQARELAAALMRLQKGGRGRGRGSSSADRVAYGGVTEIGDLPSS
jgi:hypothetical protein